jgi:hypothetical protein
MILPGWTCSPPCGCFNGEAKSERAECRACGAPRPGVPSIAEARVIAQAVRDRKSKSISASAEELSRLVLNGTQTLRTFPVPVDDGSER